MIAKANHRGHYVGSICKLLDFLQRIKIIKDTTWLEMHRIKWGHKTIGKPDWVK